MSVIKNVLGEKLIIEYTNDDFGAYQEYKRGKQKTEAQKLMNLMESKTEEEIIESMKIRQDF